MIDTILTVLSLAGGGFSWFYANASKKSKKESAEAMATAKAQSYEARRQAESMKKLADSLEQQVQAAKDSAKAAQKANTIAEQHLKVLETQMAKADENNQVAIHWDYDDENPDKRGYITIKNIGTGTAHNFTATVGFYQDFEKITSEVLGPNETLSVYVESLDKTLTRHEEKQLEAEENARLSPFHTSSFVPLIIPQKAFTIDATWTSPAGNPGRYVSN